LAWRVIPKPDAQLRVSTFSAPVADSTLAPQLERRLTQRQLTMMTMGGAIGVGLFLGSSLSIQLAGPGVILSYLFGAAIALIVAYSIAEMAVVHPVPGSFGVYAQTYLNEWSGYAVRVTYAFVQIIAIGAEVTAVAIYFAAWFPTVPQWLSVAAVSCALVAINAIEVGSFAEFEYWFAILKVLAIAAFVLIGFGLIVGLGASRPVGLSNLTGHGGILPHGMKGVWLAMSLTLTSYMGIEIIGVTAGEAHQPAKTVCYVLSITVMLAMTPWDKMGSGLTGSPFVFAFRSAGIPYAAGLMNLVVIVAALSSANTNLYLTSRTLFSLSRDGYLPRALGRLGHNGVPYLALLLSTAGMAAAILLAIFVPSHAFLSLYGIAVAGMFFVWIIILLAHLSFRRTLGPARIAALPIHLPFSPYAQIVALAALAAIASSTFFVESLQHTVPDFLLFLLIIAASHPKVLSRGRRVVQRFRQQGPKRL
jgi:amino acid transporter, AAT family